MPYANSPVALAEVLEQLPEHIYWKNKDGIYLGCNTANWKDFGLKSLTDCIGKTDYDIYPKEEAEPLRQVDLEIMRTGKPQIVEEGDLNQLYLSHKAPLRDCNNQIVGILGTSIDITNAKKAEMERLAETVAAKTKAQVEAEMRRAVTVWSGSIAHDLRSPLSTVDEMASIILDFLPILLNSHQMAADAGLPVEFLHDYQRKYLTEIPTELQKITQEMNQSIDAALTSLNSTVSGAFSPKDWVSCEAWKCISRVLQDYPFIDEQRKKIHYKQSYHFTFLGNPILFIRILSNLIKNSLYQIEKNQRGEIFISAEDADSMNIMRFRDTAIGASPEIVAHLFDGYKSNTEGGTGVGLASCKLAMQSMGGDITCHSVEGEYIEFVISFPKYDSDKI